MEPFSLESHQLLEAISMARERRDLEGEGEQKLFRDVETPELRSWEC